MTNKPPLTVTGMWLLVLMLASWNFLRVGAAIANWDALLEFASPPGPWYTALTGSFWTLACLAVWILIRRRYIHSQGVYLLTLYAYVAWWWADRVFISKLPHANNIFAAIVTAIVLIAIATDFFNKSATNYFTQRETNEQPTDQQTS